MLASNQPYQSVYKQSDSNSLLREAATGAAVGTALAGSVQLSGHLLGKSEWGRNKGWVKGINSSFKGKGKWVHYGMGILSDAVVTGATSMINK